MLKLWPSKSKKYIIGKADRADLQQCADIHATSFSSAWGDGEMASMLAQKNTFCLVSKTDNTPHLITGFLMYRISAGESEILTVAVDPKYRKSGLGARLLEEMIRVCLSERLEEIFLEVEASNLAALKLYKKHGFEKVGERKSYYSKSPSAEHESSNNNGDALIMRLDLIN